MMKRKWFVPITGLFLAMAFSVPAWATVNNTYYTYTAENGSKVSKSVSTEGTWTDDGTGLRFTSDDGHAYIDEWLYYKKSKRNPGRPTGFSYFDTNGYLVKNRFFTLGGKIYYADENGLRAEGWFIVDGKLYYAYGALDKGYIKTAQDGSTMTREGVKYTFTETGEAVSQTGSYDRKTLQEMKQSQGIAVTDGWVKDDNTWYYYRNGAPLVSEWVQDGGDWYYLGADGKYYRSGIYQIGEYSYKFDSQGKLRVNTDVRDQNNVLYHADENGRLIKKDSNVDGVINKRQDVLNRTVNKYTDNTTVQWFNAATSILTYHRGGNIKAFGGMLFLDDAEADSFTKTLHQQALLSSWGVYDRNSADQVLNTLIAQAAVSGSAWDYSRAMSNLGFYYLAGYYTETEALDRSLELAQTVQKVFHSWDEYNSSYLEGYRRFSNGDTSRDQIPDILKASVNNPFALDWNTVLTKSW